MAKKKSLQTFAKELRQAPFGQLLNLLVTFGRHSEYYIFRSEQEPDQSFTWAAFYHISVVKAECIKKEIMRRFDVLSCLHEMEKRFEEGKTDNNPGTPAGDN